MKKLLFTLFIVFSQLSAQNNFIKGVIRDKQTGKPIENANIFLAYTSIGSTTNSNGEFLIKNIPSATYKIVISHIQYNKIRGEVQVDNSTNLTLEYSLKPRYYQLPTILVGEADDKWKKTYEKFKENFLGWTESANYCKIINPYNIDFTSIGLFSYDASCEDPIYITNNYLGYRIVYYLEYFSTDGITTKYSGVPFFQELEAKSDSAHQYWEENRLKTYHGSLREFITETSKRFLKNSWNTDPLPFHIEAEFEGSSRERTTVVSSLFFPKYMRKNKDESKVDYLFPAKLFITYAPDEETLTNVEDASEIKLTKNIVTADINGRYYDIYGIHILGGYWARQRLADTLPLDYFPPEGKDVK